MPITVLSQETINQIAAGEVIERPSSVVKELLENAIDAKATAVTVEIKEGGTSLIRVTDNGSGISKQDIPLAFLRHATSKIQTVEDLLTVSSLGFRGEALSSIAAVAQVELITKTEGNLTGIRYCIEGGQEKSSEEIGAPAGTTFLVRNLFYNTPARRKFLKSAQTEGNYIIALVERMALSHPEISLRLLVNGKSRLHTTGNHKLKDIIYMVYGREIARELIPIQADFPKVHLEGYVGKPIVSRGNRTYENYYINGRYIRSGLITKAIEDAYHGFVMQHKYPFTVLHLSIDPSLLDVNVHPTKMEIRFREEESIYQAVFDTLRSALSGKELIPKVTVGKEETAKEEKKPTPVRMPEPFETHRNASANAVERSIEKEKSSVDLFRASVFSRFVKEKPAEASQGSLNPEPQRELEFPPQSELKSEQKPELKPEPQRSLNPESTAESEPEPKAADLSETTLVSQPVNPKQLDLFEEKILTREHRAEFVMIGQLFDTYWLIQYQDQFLMIDQHAAHEKVLYERTMKTLKNRVITTQQLNPPLILNLNALEEQVFKEHWNRFTEMGFEIESFGFHSYAVRGIPDNLFSIAKEELLMEMIDSLAAETGKTGSLMIEEKVALMSCKAAVKGNNRLSLPEANALIDELLQLENPYSCPHGRPTIISMSRYEIEKKFKRIVS